MGGSKDYLSILEEKHNQIVLDNSNPFSALEGCLDYYESFIPEFFSSNGEAVGIRTMYENIKEDMEVVVGESTIHAIDVNKGSYMYDEYLEGMIQFIKELKSCDVIQESDQSIYVDKLNTAKKNDSIFIESLFGGKLNSIEEMPVSEAVTNVEFLIDFIPKIKEMKTQCSVLNESSTYGNALLNDSMVMLFESVNNYCYSTLKNIVKTYEDIHTVFSPVPQHKDTEPTYKLF